MKEKNRNRNRKHRKYIKYITVVIFISFFLFNSNVNNVLGDGDYSYYLYNNPILIQTDNAKLFKEKAESSNDFRNFFDTKERTIQPTLIYTSSDNDVGYYLGTQAFFDTNDNSTFLSDELIMDDYSIESLKDFSVNNGSLNDYNPNNQQLDINSEIKDVGFNYTFGNLTVINGSLIYNGNLDYRDSNYSQINSENDYAIYYKHRYNWDNGLDYNITGFTAYTNTTGKTNFLFAIMNTTGYYGIGYQIDVWYIHNNIFRFWKTLDLELSDYPIQDLCIRENYLYLYVKQSEYSFIEVYNLETLDYIKTVYIPIYREYNAFSYVSENDMFYLGSYTEKYFYWITSDLENFYSFYMDYAVYDGFGFDNYFYTFDNYNFRKQSMMGIFDSNISYNRIYQYDNCILVNNSIYLLENCTDYYYDKGGLVNHHSYYGYHISKIDLFHYETKVIYNCSIPNYSDIYRDDKNYKLYFSFSNNITNNISIFVYNYSSEKYDKKLSIYNPKFEIYNILLNSDYYNQPNIFVIINSTTPLNKSELYIDQLVLYRDLSVNKVDIILDFGYRPYIDVYELLVCENIFMDFEMDWYYKISIFNFTLNSYTFIESGFKEVYYHYFENRYYNNSINTIHDYITLYLKIEIFILDDTIKSVLFDSHYLKYTSDSDYNNFHYFRSVYEVCDNSGNPYAYISADFWIYLNFIFFSSSYSLHGDPSTAGLLGYYYNDTILRDINYIEITTLLRYGEGITTTSDIYVLDINIVVNYNLSILIHQQREWDFPREYMELSGVVYTNYFSYNDIYYVCLIGTRNVYGNIGFFDDFIYLPYFNDDLDLAVYIPPTPTPPSMEASEPSLPTGTYWEYTSFRLTTHDLVYFDVGNWTNLEYQQIIPEQYTAKFPYKKEIIDKHDLGDWRFKIGEWKVSFNFIRNALVWILNTILLLLQYFLFLITAGLSFIFMFLGTWIITFLYNVVIFFIYIALVWILWLLYLALYWLWKGLLWIWSNIIIPLLEWIWENVIPIIMEWVIIVIAFVLTALFWMLSLGNIDFWNTYDIIYELLWIIVSELIAWFLVFVSEFPFIMLFILLYLLCVSYLYFRYMVARARGYDLLAQRYYYTFTFFFTPFRIIIDWIKALLDITPEI